MTNSRKDIQPRVVSKHLALAVNALTDDEVLNPLAFIEPDGKPAGAAFASRR